MLWPYALHVVCCQSDVCHRHIRKLDELGSHRLWTDRRLIGDHGRELHSRLSENTNGVRNRLAVIRDACIEVRKPTLFGEHDYLGGLSAGAFTPRYRRQTLSTHGIHVLFALFGSLILSMTLMPALASLALPKKVHAHDVWFVRMVKLAYAPLVRLAIRFRWVTALIAILILGISVPIARNLGAEFMPRLEEGDLLIEANRLPTAALEGAEALGQKVESIIMEFPEVKTVFCKTGRPEIANDVMGVQQTDIWVILKDMLIGAWHDTRNVDQRDRCAVAGAYTRCPILVHSTDRNASGRVSCWGKS